MKPRAIFALLKTTYTEWSEDNASRLAAALSYYTIFALAPLLLIVIAIAGLVFGQQAAQGQVFAQLQGLLGQDAAATIQSAVEKSSNTGAGTISAIIGVVMLLLSASGLFGELQNALDTIWEVKPPSGGGILATVKRRFVSMTMVLGIGFLLLVSLVLSAGVAAAGQLLGGLLPGGEALWQVVNFVLSFAVIILLFAAMYKVLPDVTISWRDVWVGAVVTALLFTLGKTLLGLYLGHSAVGSTYGAAGSLLVVLVWVYYSAQILFLGAEFTQVYARTYDTRLVPTQGAVPLTEGARAQQGIPRQEAVASAAREDGARDGAKSALPASDQDSRGGTRGGSASRQPIKKLLWVGLSSGMLAVAGLLARRAAATLWQAVLHEPPPTAKV